MENFFLLLTLLSGIILGAGFMYFYYTKEVNDDDNGDLRFEATKLNINTSTIAFADGNTMEIIPFKEGDEIVIKNYEGRLVIDLYSLDEDDEYDEDED